MSFREYRVAYGFLPFRAGEGNGLVFSLTATKMFDCGQSLSRANLSQRFITPRGVAVHTRVCPLFHNAQQKKKKTRKTHASRQFFALPR